MNRKDREATINTFGLLLRGITAGFVATCILSALMLTKGLYFGFTATLLFWFMVLPISGAGMFGLRLNLMQPVVSLAQHLVYGVVLAVVYHRLTYTGQRSDRNTTDHV